MLRNGVGEIYDSLFTIVKPPSFSKNRELSMYLKTLQFTTHNSLKSESRWFR